MRATPCGVRGTAAVTDPAFAEFGGDTTCFLIEGGGETVLVDAGSGIRLAAARLPRRGGEHRLLWLMTHYHLDHLIGFPRLSLLHDSRASIEIAAPKHGRFAADAVIPRLVEEPFWPVHFDGFQAAVSVATLPAAEDFAGKPCGGLTLRWCGVHHAGGCTAYRLDEAESGASLVIATDLEWDESAPEEKEALLALCAAPRPADVLFMDGQFTPANYERHHGWGHSRWTDAVEVAQRARARRLRVIHHAPDADDNALRGVEAGLRRQMAGAELARQGVAIDI